MGSKRPTATETRLMNGELDLFIACGAVVQSACEGAYGRMESQGASLLRSLLKRRGKAVRELARGIRLPPRQGQRGIGDDDTGCEARAALEILQNYRADSSRLIRNMGLTEPAPLLTALVAVLAGGLLLGRCTRKFENLPSLLALMEPSPSRWGGMVETLKAHCRSEHPLVQFERLGRMSPSAYCEDLMLTARGRSVLQIPPLSDDLSPLLEGQSGRRIVELRQADVSIGQVAVAPGLQAELEFLAASCRIPGGAPPVALFHGPPGTGKTFAAGAIAGELGKPLAVVQIPRILSRWVGEGEKNLAYAFDEAAAAKAVLLLDEVDAFLMSREYATKTHEVSSVNALLALLDPPRCPVILCTNHLPHLDEAVHRRVHHMLAFPVPGLPERERLWQLLLAQRGLGTGFAVDLLAEIPLTGGLISNAVSKAVRKKALAGEQFKVTGAVLMDLALQEVQKMPAAKGSRRVVGFGGGFQSCPAGGGAVGAETSSG